MSLHSPLVVSSPPRYIPIFCSSSPDIPSLDTLLKRKSPKHLKAGSRSVSIPSGAVLGFQSARLLQRDVVEDDFMEHAAKEEQMPGKRRKQSADYNENVKAEKCRTNAPSEVEKSRRSPRLGRYILNAVDAVEDSAHQTYEGAGSEHANKAEKCGTAGVRQETEPRRQVKESSSDPTNGARSLEGRALDETISHWSAQRDRTPTSEVKAAGPVKEDDPADPCSIKSFGRKEKVAEDSCKSTLTEYAGPMYNDFSVLSSKIDFQAAWSYKGSNAPHIEDSAGRRTAQSNKKSGMEAEVQSEPAPVKKVKRPTKSSRTVTNVAIARYQDAPSLDAPSSSQSFWDQSESARAVKLLEPSTKVKKNGKTKKPIKKLLDPETAQSRVVHKQEFFFGTSSQLTRDEPDSLVRDLQHAVKASEDEEAGLRKDAATSVQPCLWTSGARGEHDSLLESETTVKMIKTYSPRRESFVDIDSFDVDDSKPKLISTMSDSKTALHSISFNLLNSASKSPFRHSPSKIQKREYQTKTGASEVPAKSNTRGRPRKNATDSSTAATTKRSRAKKTAKGSDDASKSPKKRKPRTAKKRAQTSNQEPVQEEVVQNIEDIEGIEDISDVERGEEKAAKKAREAKIKPTQKQIRDEFLAGPAPALFQAITKVVKEQTVDPRSTNDLTWHEKMLLYDPIVLEDLTAWLKTSPFKDQEDELLPMTELKPWMVQLWCEDKSVCCLWREGLRGGVKLKY